MIAGLLEAIGARRAQKKTTAEEDYRRLAMRLARDDGKPVKPTDASAAEAVLEAAGKTPERLAADVAKLQQIATETPEFKAKIARGEEAFQRKADATTTRAQLTPRREAFIAALMKEDSELAATIALANSEINAGDRAGRTLDELERWQQTFCEPEAYAQRVAEETAAEAVQREARGLDSEAQSLLQKIAPGSEWYAEVARSRRAVAYYRERSSNSDEAEKAEQELVAAEKRVKDTETRILEARAAAAALRAGERPPSAIVKESGPERVTQMQTVPL